MQLLDIVVPIVVVFIACGYLFRIFVVKKGCGCGSSCPANKSAGGRKGDAACGGGEESGEKTCCNGCNEETRG